MEILIDYIVSHLPKYDFRKGISHVSSEIPTHVDNNMKELHHNKDLWMRVKCFAYDLRRFDSHAQQRLESYGGQYYMSERYFSAQELQYLMSFPTIDNLTAQNSLEQLFLSKSGVYVICASHDIAPLVEKMYGIRKGFECERDFKVYFKKFAAKKGVF